MGSATGSAMLGSLPISSCLFGRAISGILTWCYRSDVMPLGVCWYLMMLKFSSPKRCMDFSVVRAWCKEAPVAVDDLSGCLKLGISTSRKLFLASFTSSS